MSAPASTQRVLQTLQQLTAQQQRLSTDVPYFTQQAPKVEGATKHLDTHFCDQPQKLQQLLQTEQQLLRHLLQLATAAIQQLTAQLERNPQALTGTSMPITKTVVALGNTLDKLLPVARCRADNEHSAPADVANLQMLCETGRFQLDAFRRRASCAARMKTRKTPVFPHACTAAAARWRISVVWH